MCFVAQPRLEKGSRFRHLENLDDNALEGGASTFNESNRTGASLRSQSTEPGNASARALSFSDKVDGTGKPRLSS
jgi:hypothetical protein